MRKMTLNELAILKKAIQVLKDVNPEDSLIAPLEDRAYERVPISPPKKSKTKHEDLNQKLSELFKNNENLEEVYLELVFGSYPYENSIYASLDEPFDEKTVEPLLNFLGSQDWSEKDLEKILDLFEEVDIPNYDLSPEESQKNMVKIKRSDVL